MYSPVQRKPVQYTTQSDTHDLWPLVHKQHNQPFRVPAPIVPPVKLLTQQRQDMLLLAEHAGAAVISTIVLVVSMGLLMYGPSSKYAVVRVPATYMAAAITPVAEVGYKVLDSLFGKEVKAERQPAH